jgi:hypothetical protein
MLAVVLGTAGLFPFADRLEAQRIPGGALTASIEKVSGFHAQPFTGDDPADLVAAGPTRRKVFLPRAVAGLAGWLVGAVTGAYVASALPHHNCQCDDPGLEEVLYGILIGSVIGTAAGSAAPTVSARCQYGTRFGRALLGSAAGTLLGGVATLPTVAPAALVVIPISAASGAALAIGNC